MSVRFAQLVLMVMAARYSESCICRCMTVLTAMGGCVALKHEHALDGQRFDCCSLPPEV
jgi:hypothetical protein